ncbi:MAG: aldo/keto reductase [Deltaproteobacteria bacterium]|nr:aldo/keto reductase [Deltaproteobacteria bacterium]
MSSTDVRQATLPLRDGGAIPILGLGVWQAPRGGVTREAVLTALRHGYRHIDTARIYGNEDEVGAAVRDSGVPRAEVFVTTKLWNEDHGFDKAMKAFDTSLARLGLDYVDLYLVHWPVGGARKETWRALERIKAEKRARHIGVSNYLVNHLEEMKGYAKELPEVNQIEVHPFLQHRDTRAWCAKNGIVVEAYSPLTRGQRLQDPRIAAVAERVRKTPAQVLVRWSVQHGMVPLPKSVREPRIVENAGVFDFTLDDAAMKELDALDEGKATGWDPRNQD